VATDRLVQNDTVMSEQNLRAGDRVLLALPAANRDPAEFADPDTARFDRNNNRHLTFGTGIHRCLGMHLARLELRVAFEEVFRAFDDFPDRTRRGAFQRATGEP
jgi:cytochrome P450